MLFSLSVCSESLFKMKQWCHSRNTLQATPGLGLQLQLFGKRRFGELHY